MIGNSRLNNEKYYDIIFFHKNIFFSRQNIVCGFLQVWSGLVIGNFRLNKSEYVLPLQPDRTGVVVNIMICNWSVKREIYLDILDIFIRSVIFSSKFFPLGRFFCVDLDARPNGAEV